jgi:hypothetical protein
MWKSSGATIAGFFPVIRISKDGNGSNVEYGNTHAPVDIMGVCEPAMFFGQNKEPIQAENYKDEKGK